MARALLANFVEAEAHRVRMASCRQVWRWTKLLLERLAVRWEIAGLPLTDQKMLLGRYRMADQATQQWVRETIAAHVERFIPELAG
jgi:hypothetical protein